MENETIIWASKIGEYQGRKLEEFNSSKVTQFDCGISSKEKIKNVYFVGQCVFVLTEEGKVKKKGLMNYEKIYSVNNDDNDEEEEEEETEGKNIAKKNEFVDITFPNDSRIKKMKFGYSHILFLGFGGRVYALGNNYYGQLGINNMLIPVLSTPKQVKVDNTEFFCSQIYAYKNTSFAIGQDKKLYMWGKNDFLMNTYKTNIFAPKLFFDDLLVLSLRVSDGRVIIQTVKENIEDNEENNEEKSEEDNKEEDKKEEEEKFFVKKPELSILDFNEVSKAITQFINAFKDYPKIYEKFRKFYSEEIDKPISSEFIINSRAKAKELIEKARLKVDDKNFKGYEVSNYSYIQVYTQLFSLAIGKYYENLEIDKVIGDFKDAVETAIKAIDNLLELPKNRQDDYEFVVTISQILSANLQVKVLEFFVHLYSVNYVMMKKFDINYFISELKKEDYFNYQSSEAKEFLFQKLYESLLFVPVHFRHIISQSENSFQYSKMSTNIQEYLKKTNSALNNLWMSYLDMSKEAEILKMKENEFNKFFLAFQEIYNLVEEIGGVHKTHESKKNTEEDPKESEIGQKKSDKNITDFNEYVHFCSDRCDELIKKVANCFKRRKITLYENYDKKLLFNFTTASVELAKMKKLFYAVMNYVKDKSNQISNDESSIQKSNKISVDDGSK